MYVSTSHAPMWTSWSASNATSTPHLKAVVTGVVAGADERVAEREARGGSAEGRGRGEV
jgi:hypothetical protein